MTHSGTIAVSELLMDQTSRTYVVVKNISADHKLDNLYNA